MKPTVPIDQPSVMGYRLFSDYHTHPQGHRVQRYTPALLQPWVDSARKHGLTDIAFTDHDRYHAGIDFDEIDYLRERNPDLRLRAGIELDNDPTHSAAGRRWIEKHWNKLDFVLGSVHFLDRADRMFDSVPDGAEQFEGHDVNAIYADYFRRVREMAATGLVDCLAHLDLVKIHGHRPSAEIGAIVNETLDFIRARNLTIELSTAGWRKPVNELYPGDRIIELAIEKGIPFTTASDAHSHAQLGDSYPMLAQKMASFGIRQICIFDKHQRIMRAVSAEPLL
ncbi:MAG TPA: histidinol-phosphatase HisJ family protein [Candidatus Udaeobacter sp.]|jgi:histidinol-phosphatase (PHP family)|nr:histidinol-phosphatase HisJ family protein [Candidatus Udaeobacter sp.]